MKGRRKKFKQERHKKKIQESLMFLTLNVNVVCNDGDRHFLKKQHNKKMKERRREKFESKEKR